MKTRILAVDVGIFRIGLATGESDTRVVTPLKIVSNKQAEFEILKIINDCSISLIVMGLPLNADNSESAMCLKVRKFSRRLQKRADIKIVFVDEFASSAEAIERHAKSREPIDHLAAAIILQRYFAGEGIVV